MKLCVSQHCHPVIRRLIKSNLDDFEALLSQLLELAPQYEETSTHVEKKEEMENFFMMEDASSEGQDLLSQLLYVFPDIPSDQVKEEMKQNNNELVKSATALLSKRFSLFSPVVAFPTLCPRKYSGI